MAEIPLWLWDDGMLHNQPPPPIATDESLGLGQLAAALDHWNENLDIESGKELAKHVRRLLHALEE